MFPIISLQKINKVFDIFQQEYIVKQETQKITSTKIVFDELRL